jgi:hypothetical protein
MVGDTKKNQSLCVLSFVLFVTFAVPSSFVPFSGVINQRRVRSAAGTHTFLAEVIGALLVSREGAVPAAP